MLGTSAGGTGAHVAMLARGCAARGLEVTGYGPAAAGRRFFPPGGGVGFVPVEITARPRPARDALAVLRLRGLLRRQAPDVVHAHGLRAGAFAALALAGQRRPGGARPGGARARGARARGVAGRPALVVTVHNAPVRGGPAGAVHLLLEWLVARRADAVTWVCGDLAARLRRWGAADAGRALVPAVPGGRPTAVQVAGARAGMAPPGHPVVLAAGRLASQKGFGVLLAAAAGWRDRRPAPVVVIAGEGPLGPALARQARAAGVAVRFLGQRDDVPALLAAADVVVVPSLWEGQPLIVQEALRAGKPLVASRAGGIPDLTGEDAALLVPPGDPDALSAAVLSVLADPGLAARLAMAATERAAALPSAADAVAAAVALYRRLAG